MTRRELTEFIEDILATITEIETFTAGVSFDDFLGNREKILAVTKSIEILGEAVKQVPDILREQYPEVPWKSIAGMRDVLVHQYWDVDTEIVWSVVQDNLPSLKSSIAQILADL